MQVNLPRVMSVPDAANVVANIAAKEPVETKEVRDMALMKAESAAGQRADAREALEAKSEAQKANKSQDLDKETVKEVLVQTLDIVNLVMPMSDVKYEIIDEADVVQVQVVRKDNGDVIRKIPDDKILELIGRIHQMLNPKQDDSIDVRA